MFETTYPDAAGLAAMLTPALARALRTVAVAGDLFEPFVATMLPRQHLAELSAREFIEGGESSRPAVGPVGYRLSPLGWQVVALVWYRRPQEASPVIAADTASPRAMVGAG